MPRGIDEGLYSRDGRWLVLRVGVGGGRDLYGLRPGIDSGPVPLIATEFEEYSPALSPDGRWLAYVTNESGRRDVYVRPFPNVDSAKWQVSTDGGEEPLWANSGRSSSSGIGTRSWSRFCGESPRVPVPNRRTALLDPPILQLGPAYRLCGEP